MIAQEGGLDSASLRLCVELLSGLFYHCDCYMERPRVICHMMASIDGRIVTEGWPVSGEEMKQYEAVHESYNPDVSVAA